MSRSAAIGRSNHWPSTTERRIGATVFGGTTYARGVDATLVRFEHVGCSYGSGPTVVDDVDLTIERGEFVGIVGPSGCGKTTVLRAVLGTVQPTYGRITRAPGLKIGYVPQGETIDWNFPVTVRELVGMRLDRRSGDRRALVDAVVGRLGLDGLADRHIRQLSGGQQRRVFVARALLGDPDVLVLDEPAEGVDVATRHEMLHLLVDLHAAGTSIVLTTHDMNGLAAHLPRLVCLNRTVIADGPPAQVLHPYVLQHTYGAPMDVLQHGGMPVVLEHRAG